MSDHLILMTRYPRPGQSKTRFVPALGADGAARLQRKLIENIVEVARRWRRQARFEDFSLALLILECIQLGARFHLYFPVDMVLMVKAIVTFEAVGQMPDLDAIIHEGVPNPNAAKRGYSMRSGGASYCTGSKFRHS